MARRPLPQIMVRPPRRQNPLRPRLSQPSKTWYVAHLNLEHCRRSDMAVDEAR